MDGFTRRSALLFPAAAIAPVAAQPRLELRDRTGVLLGWISVRTGGVREARDRAGRLLGTYHVRPDETRDGTGRLLYRGDALAALIVCHGG